MAEYKYTSTPTLTEESFKKLCSELTDDEKQAMAIQVVNHFAETEQLTEQQHKELTDIIHELNI